MDSVLFKEDFRCFEKGEVVIFDSNLTIITGNNGTGKSSLISCIRSMYETKWSMSQDSRAEGKIEVTGSSTAGDCATKAVGYLDLSLDLYKNSPEIDFDDTGAYLRCLQASSGEGLLIQLVNFLLKHSKSSGLIIIDEPERGLSIKNQIMMSGLIKKFSDDYPGSQFIVTTHSEQIIRLKEKIWSTSHKREMTSEEYMDWLYL